MAEGATVRIPVTLSRALPVAVRVPYTVGVSGSTGGLAGLSPSPDSGLLFPAGETVREITFNFAEGFGRTGGTDRPAGLGRSCGDRSAPIRRQPAPTLAT